MFEDTSGMDAVHCSFCGKSQDEVKKIVAGPGVYICNECVDLCQQMHFVHRQVLRPAVVARRRLVLREEVDEFIQDLRAFEQLLRGDDSFFM